MICQTSVCELKPYCIFVKWNYIMQIEFWINYIWANQNYIIISDIKKYEFILL